MLHVNVFHALYFMQYVGIWKRGHAHSEVPIEVHNYKYTVKKIEI